MTVAVVFQTLLTNAITVAILSLIVVVIGRYVKKPAVAHCLWVLLLVKLLTPSIVSLPFAVNINDAWLPAVMSSGQVGSSQADVGFQSSQTSVTAGTITTRNSRDVGLLTDENAMVRAADAHAASANLLLLIRSLLAVWICGSVVYMLKLAWSQFRFSRFLRRNEEVDVDLIGEGYNLAWEMGLENPPRVRVLRGALSPMLCGFGRGLTLIIPAELSDRLSRESRATLIVHELAHYMRRDHWVRVLELTASIVFWWNPVVWFIQKQIEAVEEECCDARVVAHFPSRPRQYAEALLDTIDFLAERTVLLPPVACGLGWSASLLRRRLTQIMSDEVQQPGNGRQEKLALFFGAALIVPLQVVQFTNPQPLRPDKDASVAIQARREAPTAAQANVLLSIETHDASLRVIDPAGHYQMIQTADGTWVVQSQTTRQFRKLPSDDVTCAAFVSDSRLVIGTESGEVQLIDCTTNSIHRVRRFATAIRSVDWSTSKKRLAVLDVSGSVYVLNASNLGVEGYRRLDSTLVVNSVRFNRDGEQLFVATGDRDVEGPGAVLVVDRKTLLIVEAVETPEAVAVVSRGEAANEVNAYEWTGRVNVMTPNPLTSVAARWLPKDAAPDLAFSSQIDDTQYVPEKF